MKNLAESQSYSPATTKFVFSGTQATATFLLQGDFKLDPQFIGPADVGAKIRLNFRAKEVQMAPSGEGQLDYTLNGKPITAKVTGVPNASTLTDSGQAADGTLEITIPRGVQAHSFTFG